VSRRLTVPDRSAERATGTGEPRRHPSEEPDATPPSPGQHVQENTPQCLGGRVLGVLGGCGAIRLLSPEDADEGPRRLLWEEYGLPASPLGWPLLAGALVGYEWIGLATAGITGTPLEGAWGGDRGRRWGSGRSRSPSRTGSLPAGVRSA
jgi:hypothetical protein